MTTLWTIFWWSGPVSKSSNSLVERIETELLMIYKSLHVFCPTCTLLFFTWKCLLLGIVVFLGNVFYLILSFTWICLVPGFVFYLDLSFTRNCLYLDLSFNDIYWICHFYFYFVLNYHEGIYLTMSHQTSHQMLVL